MKKIILLLAIAALASSVGCRHTCGWRWFNRNECCVPSCDPCGCGSGSGGAVPYDGQVIYGGTMPGPVTTTP